MVQASLIAFYALAVSAVASDYVSTTEYISTTPEEVEDDTLDPTEPQNVTVLGYNSTTIYLRWLEPKKPNGIIEGYWIHFINGNLTDVRTHRIQGQQPARIYYNFTNLKPDTTYKIMVRAFTANNEGKFSDAIINKTDIGGPSSPKLLNLSCQAQDTMFIQWQRPEEFFYSIDFYFIYYCIVGEYIYENVTLEAHKDHLETSYTIKNVTTNAVFEVQVSAATYSRYSGRLIHGKPSPVKQVYMQPNCDQIQQSMRHSTIELSAGMIAGVVCAVLAFVLAISAFVVWRKCFHGPYMYTDDRPSAVGTSNLDWNAPPAENEQTEYKGSIAVADFTRHAADLHADGDIGFSKEYEAIQAIADNYSSEHSNHPDNRVKNRYLNIIAYDHSRVQLLAMAGTKKVDYINANYIDGFQMYKAYIGTQGPLPCTFDTFWRMVWEQRVTIIVMITNLVERGRDSLKFPHCKVGAEQIQRKCDMYWPKEGIETYGIIQVRLVKEDVMATYTVRTLAIRHLKFKNKKSALAEKLVYQYHYTNWPDHGTPDHPLPVLHFVKKSAAANPVGGGPIIVHCSAGVGRTGTYIVLDAMLKQIRVRNEVNVYGLLRHIRCQRNFLVQTEEQYIFIHDALVEAIEAGETNISREQIPRYVEALQANGIVDKAEPWRPLEVLFRMVVSFTCKDFNLVSAHKVINQPKNRTHVVPVESSRVHLTPKPGEDGSDYVNATWIQGFHNLREFIITQHPLKETIKDFWQMIWDHNAQTIVMLGIIDNDTYGVFWPTEHEPIDAETYKVKLTGEHTHSTYVTRDFTMQSLQDDYELHVRMVHCANWPHHCASISEIYHLPNSVQETNMGYQNGPIVVVDKFGGAEAGTFCCLITLKKQLAYENHADVYMYAKLCHNRRPGMWTNPNQFLGMHLAVQALCSPPEVAAADNIYMLANGSANGNVSTAENVRMPPEEVPLIVRGVCRVICHNQ